VVAALVTSMSHTNRYSVIAAARPRFCGTRRVAPMSSLAIISSVRSSVPPRLITE
jgi:hypothetical protein